ncbi:predicted nucleic acid-binding protein, containing PIN domain [Thermococcus kodakarensis KOD1]|uniref:Ribonuclease VapC n=1 Tax=Thermococcus kodakarensis (strain ATCC BAA-918 / JCM 12380 / KOD1) TaxID=69014 RepID=Q5JGM2_THEKO|nr:type II toxin-antitoxin system VapC family toxin [Thermococcus kodakarensis]WCN27257.1 type II toxin-antitoxin system VapC family toxin [Thermococcus kodakarensis]WCN29543.1 type II toxin-antitoxin system VapC family toxin [Thermococcus kodakarensis]BAD85445.1 predicted nucleic acid-binding protein, containing PIN domain [Thermococcus kodakarensis KOD1]
MKRPVPEVIYLDTSALIALFNRNDKNHERAVSYLREALESGNLFLLSRPVLMEYLNGLSKRYGKEIAKENYDALTSSSFVYIENETEADWRKAWEFFFKYRDQRGIDLFDSLSFAIMERLGLKTAFTFDSDFEVHGFRTVP